jgi:protein-tyrosine phosphatase
MGRHSTGCDERAVHVLFVCEANLCRSPMAEHLARSLLPRGGGVEVASAGTAAQPGHAMDPVAEFALATPAGPVFRTRRLEREMILAADLVLTADRGQRARVAELDASAASRTFTVLELARLTDPAEFDGLDPRARVLTAVDSAQDRRGTAPRGRPADDDIPDPYGRGRTAMATCRATLDLALRWLGP